MAAVVLAMTAATVLEKARGTNDALNLVYHSPWFMALWGVAAVSGMVLLLRQGISNRLGTVGLHLGLVVILAGALVTHLTGESGELHLRTGSDATSYIANDGEEAQLSFGLRLEGFTIDYYPVTNRPMDYRSEVTVLPEGERRTITMNHILKWRGYRFYQADYDEDRLGSILAVSHDPWGVGITYAGYILLLVSMLGFFFQKETGFREQCRKMPVLPVSVKRTLYGAGLLLLAGCFWLICRKWLFEPLMPVLRSPLLWIHVLSMIISYTIFALVALMGIAGLFLRNGNGRTTLQTVSLVALYPAVFLLTFGTFIGAVWANISWGNYWAWDPKETWALVTLLVYSFALHGSSLKVFQKPRFFHWYAILAFLCVLITYFGVNLLLGGIHAYS